MLEVRNVSVSYGAINAVKNVSMVAHSGAITALIGANGAGKSSLLKTISGIVAPKSGIVVVNGEDITTLPSHERARRGVAHAMEGRRIFHQHTVEENLITAWHFRRPKGEFKLALQRVYEQFPVLVERRNAKAGTLSGGQQQMLILSMATLHSPRVILLDEPSLGLAPLIVSQIYDFIRRYCAEGDRVVLVSEQMVSMALKVADFGYVFKHGEIAFEGSREQLRSEGVESMSSAYLGGAS